MSDATNYETKVQAIRVYNQPILAAFEASLEQSGLTRKTVKAHVHRVVFFAEYLLYDVGGELQNRVGISVFISSLQAQFLNSPPISI